MKFYLLICNQCFYFLNIKNNKRIILYYWTIKQEKPYGLLELLKDYFENWSRAHELVIYLTYLGTSCIMTF